MADVTIYYRTMDLDKKKRPEIYEARRIRLRDTIFKDCDFLIYHYIVEINEDRTMSRHLTTSTIENICRALRINPDDYKKIPSFKDNMFRRARDLVKKLHDPFYENRIGLKYYKDDRVIKSFPELYRRTKFLYLK